jgi:methylase of polypeptide subunit release factors
MIPRRGSEAVVVAAVESAKIITRHWAAEAAAAAAVVGSPLRSSNATAPSKATFRALDLGTGSGALLLAFLSEMRQWIDQCCAPAEVAAASVSSCLIADDNKVCTGSEFSSEAAMAAFVASGGQAGHIVWCGVGLDVSCEALEVARSNASRLAVPLTPISFAVADYDRPAALGASAAQALSELVLTGVEGKLVGNPSPAQLPSSVPKEGQHQHQQACFDIVVCNPPYSARTELNRLSAQTKEHEPALALYGKECVASSAEGGADKSVGLQLDHDDPLRSYRSLGCLFSHPCSPLQLSARGGASSLSRLIVEAGKGQFQAVKRLVPQAESSSSVARLGYDRFVKDVHGTWRAVVFSRLL